jgi:CTP synthase (UTP-ammonia lyase)
MPPLRVTEDEVKAAQLEVEMLRRAGVEPDAMVVKLAEAAPITDEVRAEISRREAKQDD